jgi:acyl carrier protein
MDGSLEDVREIFAGLLRVAVSDIDPDASLQKLPNVNSAAILQATLTIEDHFGVEFPDELVLRLETIGETAALVDELRRQQGQPRR